MPLRAARTCPYPATHNPPLRTASPLCHGSWVQEVRHARRTHRPRNNQCAPKNTLPNRGGGCLGASSLQRRLDAWRGSRHATESPLPPRNDPAVAALPATHAGEETREWSGVLPAAPTLEVSTSAFHIASFRALKRVICTVTW
ncbi:MAG: hypothetical protein WDW38_001155 [Sanguina aurantia]